MRPTHRATWPLLVVLALVASGIGWQIAAGAHTSSPAGLDPQSTGTSIASTITISGNWEVKTSISYAGETIDVEGGVVVDPGATLTLTNVDLELAEPTSLDHGIEIRGGGSLIARSLSVSSLTPANHLWVRADANSYLNWNGGSLQDLGGNAGGKEGLILQNQGTTLTGLHFNEFFQAIVDDQSPYLTLSEVYIGNSTANNPSTWAVWVAGTADHLTITDSTFAVPQPVGVLSIGTPYAKVVGNRFTIDPNTTAGNPIHLTCAHSGTPSASYSYFANNTITGAGLVVDGSSHVTISGNTISDTGKNGEYGIMAEVPIGSAPGLWSTGVVIDGNHVSDYSRYGIRLQQNVTDFVVHGNTLTDPSTHPGPPSTEKWGGLQIDGIYLIRGVTDGVVSGNLVDMSDSPSIAANGLTVEDRVSSVWIIDNVFRNVSGDGVVLQGVDPSNVKVPWWESGPSTYIFVGNNEFVNDREVQQTNFPFFGIDDWMWANHTTVENNTFIGWQDTNSYFVRNGAAVISSGSFGTYENNTVNGARYGFVFTYFGGEPNAKSGEFNRSYNLVYDNHLYGITQAAVQETPDDGMGALTNLVDSLDNSAGSGVGPEAYLEAIGSVTALGAFEAGGQFSQTMTTENPVAGGESALTTSLTWSLPDFSIESTATLPGKASYAVTIDAVTATSVRYTVPTVPGTREAVTVAAPSGSYSAVYNVTVEGIGKSFTVRSSAGPATFSVNSTGILTIEVVLLSWSSTAPVSAPTGTQVLLAPPSPGGGSPPTSWPSLTASPSAVPAAQSSPGGPPALSAGPTGLAVDDRLTSD